MTLKRWLPTFLAVPLGGWLAFGVIGSLDDVASAAAGGFVVGAFVGAGQWLALRPHGFGLRWAGYTAAAVAAGTAAGAAITDTGTTLPDVMLAGLLTGAAVGAAQSSLLPGGRAVSALWTAVTAACWSLGWLASSGVIDIEEGFYVFGSSGALLMTVLTGVVLRRILAAPRAMKAV
jgi:hypothetical protein